MKMLTVRDRFPAFDLKAVVSTDPKAAFTQISDRSGEGKWKVVFFWPKDFTFVCPTEIASFGKLNGEFVDRDAVVYGVSTDSEFVHLAWRQNHVIGRPGVEKTDFELWSLAVSAINGCGMCVDAHERELRKAGVSMEAVQAVVRIAAVVHAVAATLDGEATLSKLEPVAA
jgi:AhpD family alkylhydroperoxidase